jgi:hypothetical protein
VGVRSEVEDGNMVVGTTVRERWKKVTEGVKEMLPAAEESKERKLFCFSGLFWLRG